MKRRSIQFKFLTIIIAAMLAVAVFIGGQSVFEVDKFVQQQTEFFVRATCEKEAAQVNDIFGDMEKSVNIMTGYALGFFDSMAEIQERDKQLEVIEHTEKMFADVAENTTSAIAYYIRFNPEISDGKTGFFYSKIKGGEAYVRFPPTDISAYDKDDIEHVGWYWQPYEAGEPVWLQPYYNKNNDVMMISYVVPMYCEGQFVGVVGMDFDYTILLDTVRDITIYENGFAHLQLDGADVYYGDEKPHSYDPEEYLQVSAELQNGMTLVISVSYDDMSQTRYEITIRILCSVLVLAVVFCVITILMVRKIVNPLKKLTEASRKLADGDYEAASVRSDTYEIQLLSTAFENMSMHLREHKKLQYLLAYQDSLTGLRNTTSYKVWVNDFDEEIQKQSAEFGVVVLDVNFLKETNDKYGHDVGNKLIVAVAHFISGIFKRSPVFRIGGDEFLVILQNRDLEDYEELSRKFDLECANEYIEVDDDCIPISIAKGFAKYDPTTDKQFVDVFNRADDAMYQHKRKMKSSQEIKKFFREKDAAGL